MPEATAAVSAAGRQTYERDGVACLRGLFSANWLAFLAEAIDETMANPGPHAEEYTPSGGSGRFPLDWKASQ